MPKWTWIAIAGVVVVVAVVFVVSRISGGGSSAAAPVPSQAPQTVPGVSEADQQTLDQYSQTQMQQWQTLLSLIQAQASGASGGSTTNQGAGGLTASGNFVQNGGTGATNITATGTGTV